jgi:hypothetical protein
MKELLELIAYQCKQSREFSKMRCFNYAQECLRTAKIAAETYQILVKAEE